MLARPPKVQYPRSRWHVSCAAFVSLLPPCDLLDALGRSASYCKRHMARKRTHEQSPCLRTSSRHWQTTLLFGPAVNPDAPCIVQRLVLSQIYPTCTANPTLIERNPPPRGGFLFTKFPDQEPFVRRPPSKDLYQVCTRFFEGGSSYTQFLMREHSK